MSVPAAVSLITLGVRDVVASTSFYEALGFERSSASIDGDVSFFRTAGGLLGLYGDSDLQHDATWPTPVADGAFRGVTLAINVHDRATVDAALASAEQSGARNVKAPTATEWGGYHGYFADPDGHLWEVAHNPFWPLDERGLPQLP